jgi:hypothetical protein
VISPLPQCVKEIAEFTEAVGMDNTFVMSEVLFGSKNWVYDKNMYA